MFTKRQIKILEIILKNFSGITGAQLGEIFDVSARTIRKDISAINNILVSGNSFRIDSSNKQGYFVKEKDIKGVKELLDKTIKNDNDFGVGEVRIFKVLGRILL